MLKAFLNEAKSRLFNQEQVVFVVGNESADLDSVASALSLAYLWRRIDDKALVPVVNNRKEVLCMRGEIIYALSQVQLSLDDLLYADSLPKQFEAVLVDHNEPSCKWEDYDFKVHAVIDHHVDGGLFRDANSRSVQVCASTCSLVAELCKDGELEVIRPLIETALVFDTVNWTWRVTEFDIQIGQKLFQVADKEALHESCMNIMRGIENALIDESQIDPFLLLFKDYKSYKCLDIAYGISVAHIPLQGISQGDASLFSKSVVERFMREEHHHIFAIITAVREPGQYSFYQEFALFSRCQVRFGKLIEFLTEPLQLVSRYFESGDQLTFGFFDLRNLEYSRKKIAPMMHRYLL